MKILIDGDACPSIPLIENIARNYNIPVTIFVDTNHNINSSYSKIKIVDEGNQNVDIKLINEVNNNDLVVTQDYGVAVMAIGKMAHAINPNGLIYTNENIDMLLLNRHINRKLRNYSGRVKGPRKRNKSDDEKLISNLEKIIIENKGD